MEKKGNNNQSYRVHITTHTHTYTPHMLGEMILAEIVMWISVELKGVQHCQRTWTSAQSCCWNL